MGGKTHMKAKPPTDMGEIVARIFAESLGAESLWRSHLAAARRAATVVRVAMIQKMSQDTIAAMNAPDDNG